MSRTLLPVATPALVYYYGHDVAEGSVTAQAHGVAAHLRSAAARGQCSSITIACALAQLMAVAEQTTPVFVTSPLGWEVRAPPAYGVLRDEVVVTETIRAQRLLLMYGVACAVYNAAHEQLSSTAVDMVAVAGRLFATVAHAVQCGCTTDSNAYRTDSDIVTPLQQWTEQLQVLASVCTIWEHCMQLGTDVRAALLQHRQSGFTAAPCRVNLEHMARVRRATKRCARLAEAQRTYSTPWLDAATLLAVMSAHQSAVQDLYACLVAVHAIHNRCAGEQCDHASGCVPAPARRRAIQRMERVATTALATGDPTGNREPSVRRLALRVWQQLLVWPTAAVILREDLQWLMRQTITDTPEVPCVGAKLRMQAQPLQLLHFYQFVVGVADVLALLAAPETAWPRLLQSDTEHVVLTAMDALLHEHYLQPIGAGAQEGTINQRWGEVGHMIQVSPGVRFAVSDGEPMPPAQTALQRVLQVAPQGWSVEGAIHMVADSLRHDRQQPVTFAQLLLTHVYRSDLAMPGRATAIGEAQAAFMQLVQQYTEEQYRGAPRAAAILQTMWQRAETTTHDQETRSFVPSAWHRDDASAVTEDSDRLSMFLHNGDDSGSSGDETAE